MNTTRTAAAYPGPYAIGLTFDDDRTQIIAADGSHVASVEIDPLAETAALLAAAPELRDALAMLVNLHGRRGNDRTVVDGIVQHARAILARINA